MAQTIFLAVPIAIAQIAQMLMSMTDQVVMGRLGTDALAAGGLGANIAIFLIVVCQGVLAAIGPLVSQARGAAQDGALPRGAATTGRIGDSLAGGLVVASLLAVPVILALCSAAAGLALLGEPPALAAATGVYERAIVWGVLPALWFGAVRTYFSAIERPRPVMLVAFGGLFLNGLLNWVLVFGHLGIPALGLYGSGLATALVFWVMAVTLTGYGLVRGLIPGSQLLSITGWELARAVMAVSRLGWSIGALFCVEMGLFSLSAVLMGYFGAVALAGHQIAMGIGALTFMVPFGIAQAATVRVGFHTGAGALPEARRAGFAALALGIGFMAIMAVALLAGRGEVIRLYLDPADPSRDAVALLGSSMLALAAVYQVFDGAQTISAGALRGLKDTRTPLVVALIGYWGLGLTIGIVLAFWSGAGPLGFWWGFLIGLAVGAVLLTWRFDRLTRPLIAAPKDIVQAVRVQSGPRGRAA
ncbi:MAG TPA: MATE family efflux transporter [Stellaceae bacterium]|nr:MATE family efflux transporter [Stellaceae bacterium]